ncbi:MAG TPA: OmpA family protein [Bryobacteraceae bacterium]|nr:OmpA family protein [Bryobacteraceae bacterium]
MTSKLLLSATLGFFCTLVASAQYPPEHSVTVPIYRVTVVDRTVSAVDYQYRNGPTNIDFRGTVLLPQAKGDAIVESKTGRTEIAAHFDRLLAPTRFGPEYLTYVLWAITPDGHAKNLGEILPGSSDKARLLVTTDLQTFGLIVTAEPYSAVRLPSDVVVLENQPRPDTIGGREPIQAKYELLPRGHYTYNVQEGMAAAEANAVRLSPHQYQSVVELYEAQNAVQIAQSAEAGRYAPDTLGKAQDQLRQAQEALDHKGGMTMVVTLARHSAQTAEDARILAIQRKQGDELARAQEQAARAQAQLAQAEAAAQTAQTQAAAEHALLEQERAASRAAQGQAQAAAAAANAAAAHQAPQIVIQTQPPQDRDEARKKESRLQLLAQLNGSLPARDTPRGLTLTLPDSDFQGPRVSPAVYDRLARVAAILRAHPDLNVEVDGNEQFCFERAHAVRGVLIQDGLPASAVVARGLGDSRPLTSNATAAGREQNRRVEIVVSGNPIGDMPYWAQSYRLAPSR